MRKISLYLMLLTSAVFVASCDKPNVRMHTIIYEDGRCERQVTYSTVMSQEERDSLWGGDNVCWAQPMPECLNIDAFMGSHTDVEGDTVTTTFSNIFNTVEEMCQQTPLQLNGRRLQSTAKLEKRFRWFYTEYIYEETFCTVADTFKLPATNYADKDIVSYWFTGQPNLIEGLNGAEASEKLSKMEPFVTKWFNDNIFKLCFDYIVNHYDSIRNPPVSKEKFMTLQDSLAKALIMDGDTDWKATEEFEKFFHSDAYAPFFDDETPLGKGLSEELSNKLNIFWFSVPYTLEMPGMILNPGTGIIKDGIIHYSLTGERLIPGDYTITATSRVTHVWALIVTILIILIAIGTFLYRRKPSPSLTSPEEDSMRGVEPLENKKT